MTEQQTNNQDTRTHARTYDKNKVYLELEISDRSVVAHAQQAQAAVVEGREGRLRVARVQVHLDPVALVHQNGTARVNMCHSLPTCARINVCLCVCA